jgi:pimeloyl-ACP methyl ester carboxylesterase
VRVPAVVAVGELDEPAAVEISRRLAQRLPDAGFVCLPDTAHLRSLDAPEQVIALIREAVDSAP